MRCLIVLYPATFCNVLAGILLSTGTRLVDHMEGTARFYVCTSQVSNNFIIWIFFLNYQFQMHAQFEIRLVVNLICGVEVNILVMKGTHAKVREWRMDTCRTRSLR